MWSHLNLFSRFNRANGNNYFSFMLIKNIFKIRSNYILLLIITFALFLRLTGVNWGLQHQNIPRYSTHFDEAFSVTCCKQIDINKLDINPESAQVEGSLMYYLWYGNAFVLNQIGLLHKMPKQIISIDQNYADFIFYSRLLIIFFDILSLLLIYCIVKKISKNINASLIAAFIFAIIPFEIMHSNYMRIHILLNTFLLLIIYFSLFIYEKENVSLFIKIGIILGLCVATRYTFIIVILIPILFFYYKKFLSLKRKTFYQIISIAFNYRLLIMLLFLIVGLFIGNPSWILDFNSVLNGIKYVNSTAISLNNDFLVNITRITNYIFWIIPAGTFYLWILFYPTYIYSFFLKKYLKYVIPLSIFAIVYFIPMALYYSIFAIRVALPLFPIFTIVSGIVIAHILQRFSANKIILYPFITIMGFIVISTAAFSSSVVKAMGNITNDPYIQLSEYFQNKTNKKELKIVVIAPVMEQFILPNLYYIFNAIPEKKIKMFDGNYEKYYLNKTYNSIVNYNALENDSVDYVVFCNIDYSSNDNIRNVIGKLTKNNDFVFEKQFKNEICLKNIYYNYTTNAPHDFRYPFQIFYLLKQNRH